MGIEDQGKGNIVDFRSGKPLSPDEVAARGKKPGTSPRGQSAERGESSGRETVGKPHSLETEEERFEPFVRLLESLPQFGPLEPRQEELIETKLIPQLENYQLGDLLAMTGSDPQAWEREPARFHAIARRAIQDIEDLLHWGGDVPEGVRAAIAHYQSRIVPMG